MGVGGRRGWEEEKERICRRGFYRREGKKGKRRKEFMSRSLFVETFLSSVCLFIRHLAAYKLFPTRHTTTSPPKLSRSVRAIPHRGGQNRFEMPLTHMQHTQASIPSTHKHTSTHSHASSHHVVYNPSLIAETGRVRFLASFIIISASPHHASPTYNPPHHTQRFPTTAGWRRWRKAWAGS